jgi:LDH2 family malate/lactate/ureidoglycolate dehydrogenase
VAELARYMRGAKHMAGVTRILLPGERETALAKKQTRTGILLPPEVRKAIDTAARELGLAAPL